MLVFTGVLDLPRLGNSNRLLKPSFVNSDDGFSVCVPVLIFIFPRQLSKNLRVLELTP